MKFKYSFPPIKETVLENGLRLILVPDDEQKGVTIAFQLPAGRFSDPLGREGTAELTVALMQKGTESLSFEQFSDKLEHTGSALSANVGEEHTHFEIRFVDSFFDEMFPLFFDMICKPSLKESEYKRIKKEMITAIQAESVDPIVIANRHFYVQLAGKLHPAGRFHTLESIKKNTLGDVTRFYGDYFTPQESILVVAGSFDVSAFESSWIPRITQWAGNKRDKTPVIGEAIKVNGTGVRLINKADTTQTTLMIGHGAPGEMVSEKNAAALANFIFGAGNFSSRLMTRIRSAGGQTYGISSQIVSERHFGAFLISTSTQNSQLANVLDSVLDEYRIFCEHGVTEEEYLKAKQFSIGNLAFQLEGIHNVVEKLLWLRFYGFDDSYIEQFEKRMEEITFEHVNRAIKTFFSIEKLVVVAVGKKTEISRVLAGRYPVVQQFNYRAKI